MNDPFPLQRSIRQGCPLAPYLYFLTTNALGYILQSANKLKLISRIFIPQDVVVINSQCVNDNLLFFF